MERAIKPFKIQDTLYVIKKFIDRNRTVELEISSLIYPWKNPKTEIVSELHLYHLLNGKSTKIAYNS